jgi:hypothetical protein
LVSDGRPTCGERKAEAASCATGVELPLLVSGVAIIGDNAIANKTKDQSDNPISDHLFMDYLHE